MKFKERVYVVVSATQRGVLDTFDRFVMDKNVRNRLVSVSKDRREAILTNGESFIFVDEEHAAGFRGRESVKIMSDAYFCDEFIPYELELEEEE